METFFDLELEAFGGTAALTGHLNTEDTKNTLKLQDSFNSETRIIDRPLWCFQFRGTWVITHQLNPIPQIICKHCKNKCSGHLKAPYVYIRAFHHCCLAAKIREDILIEIEIYCKLKMFGAKCLFHHLVIKLLITVS